MTRRLAFAAAALLLAPGIAAAAPGSARLLPLSDADAYRTRETGCEFGFRRGRQTFVFMIGRSLILRDAPGRAGLHVCRITDRQFGAFGDATASIACGGSTLAVRRTGRTIGHPEADSAETPAVLTIRRGGATRSIRGTWGSAC